MFTFESFTFSGDKFYRDQTEIMFSDLVGLTLLKGRNLDGGSEEDKSGVSNGTGKTRLIQLLEGFIFAKTQRGFFKKMVLPQFKGTLKFTDREGNHWSFTYAIKDGWDISKNDLPIKISHKASDCQEKLQKLLGITKDEWGYFVHINAQSLNILLRGKPTERRAYLEQFFAIDNFYSTKFEEYNIAWKKEKDLIAELKTERARLEDVKISLGKLPDLDTLETDLLKCEADIIAAKEEIDPLETERTAILTQIESWTTHQNLFVSLQGMDAVELKDEQTKLMERKLELDRLQKGKIALDLLVTTKLTPHMGRKPKRTEQKPEESQPSRETITEKGVLLSQMKEKLRLKRLLTPLAQQIDAAALELTMSSEEIETKRSELHKEQSDLNEHCKLIKEGGDVCPTCKQSLNFILEGMSVPDRISAIELRLSENKKQRAVCVDQQAKITACDKLINQHAVLSDEFSRFPNFGVKISEAEAELDALKDLANRWDIYSRELEAETKWTSTYDVLLSEAKALGYPEALGLDYSEELTTAKTRLAEVETDLKQFERFEALTDVVVDLPQQSILEKRRDSIALKLQELSLRTGALSEAKGVLRTQKISVVSLKGQEEVLLEKLSKTQAIESECKILELLKDFYNSDGFKVYELKRRCLKMIERANYWSQLSFQEPYRWSMSDDLDDLDFLIQPIKDPDTEPYPVGTLSSGEINRAIRTLLFSSLELIPPKKRTNFLALDEIESNLDKAGMLAFTDGVLPRLKEMFNEHSIFVISHQESLHNSGVLDHLALAERKDRKTKLTVHPHYQRRRTI